MPGLLHTQCLAYYRVWSTTSLVYYIHTMPGLLHNMYSVWSTTESGQLHRSGELQDVWSTTYMQCLVYYICSAWSTKQSGQLHKKCEPSLVCYIHTMPGLLHLPCLVYYIVNYSYTDSGLLHIYIQCLVYYI